MKKLAGILLVSAVVTSALAQEAAPTTTPPQEAPKSVPMVPILKKEKPVVGQVPEYKLLADGTTAPDFTVVTPEGKKVKLSSFRSKVVILDFWATWCGPCQVSMPGLQEIYKTVKDKNVVVLSVNTWDEKDAFQKWVKENSGTKYDFTFVRDPAEGDRAAIRKASIAKRLYQVPGIPTFYVIGTDGKIIGSRLGSGNDEGVKELLKKAGVEVK